MNKVILIGRITKDLELKEFDKGGVVNLTLAVDRTFGEGADFIPVVVWDRGNYKQATNLAKYNGKGSQIAVEGSIQIRSYEYEGQNRYVTEVIADRVLYLNSRTNQYEEAEDIVSSDDLPF